MRTNREVARRLWTSAPAAGAVLVLMAGCVFGKGDHVRLELLQHDREPTTDALPAGVQADGLVRGSSRLLGEVDGVRVWAARAERDRVCLLVEQGPTMGCTSTGTFNDEGIGVEAQWNDEALLLKLVPDDYGTLAQGTWDVIGSNLYVQRQ